MVKQTNTVTALSADHIGWKGYVGFSAIFAIAAEIGLIAAVLTRVPRAPLGTLWLAIVVMLFAIPTPLLAASKGLKELQKRRMASGEHDEQLSPELLLGRLLWMSYLAIFLCVLLLNRFAVH